MTTTNEWSGAVGDVWAREWRRTDRTFAGLSPHLDAAIRAAAPESGHVIDIGCGAGSTSLALAAARPDLTITGVDISPGLIAVARERAKGIGNLNYIAADILEPGIALPTADLIYSRHGVMFFADPVGAFVRLRTVASEGARVVFSCFRSLPDNRWAYETMAAANGAPPAPPPGYVPGPFAFADPGFVQSILEAARWSDIDRQSIDFAYCAGEGDEPVADALEFFRRIGPTASQLRAADPADQEALIERIRPALEARRDGNIVEFPAAAWIWTARA